MSGRQKLFQVHRYDWNSQGGTVHLFSDPLPRDEAERLLAEWESMSIARVRRLYTKTTGFRAGVSRLGDVELLPYKPPRVYNDGKRRTVTVNGITYEWQCAPDPQEGGRNVTTIFYNGTAVYR